MQTTSSAEQTDRATISLTARIVTAVLFVFSGFSALAYQLVWTRQLSLVFGASATAEAAVLAAYMGGLGVGALLMSRWIDNVRRPILLYALLELVIALAALAVAPLLDLARVLYISFYPAMGDASTAVFYWICTTAILALPTCCMGATLPLLIKHWVRSSDQIGQGIAVLYMANTFGAAAGVLATGFVLIPNLGLGNTLWVAVGLNVCIALAVGIVWLSGRLRAPFDADMDLDRSDTSPGDRATADRRAIWMYPLIALSGVVGMAYEVFWSRALTPTLGGSLFAFATMLAAFLLGISLGSSVTPAIPRSRRACRLGFGIAQAGIAVCSLTALWALDSGWAAVWIHAAPLSVQSVALVAAILMPGAFLLGASFPLAIRAVASTPSSVSSASGKIYAWNTAGTVVGAVACGFWWLPALQFDGTAALLTAISLGSASIAWLLAGGPVPKGLAALAAAAAVTILWSPPPAPWSLIGQSVLEESFDPEKLVYFGVGRSSTVTVQRVADEFRLSTNGLPESSIQLPGGRTARYTIARWLALLPTAARPDADQAMVIGFGAGITAQAFPDRIRRIDVAELESEVIKANRFLAPERLDDPLADPRLKIFENDARNLLATRNKTYDLIVSQPSHPWTAGASNLFTREHFQLVDSRLTESGVFLQWIGLRFVDQELLASMVITLRDTFRHVQVFRPPPTGAALLIASQEPIDLKQALKRSWTTDAEAWANAGIHTPQDVLAAQWLDESGAEAYAARGRISTDYRNLMATRAPWVIGRAQSKFPQVLSHPDPIAELQRTSADLYPLRRMLALRQMDRAQEAVKAVPPNLRVAADGLWDLARNNRLQGVRGLEAALNAPDPTARSEAAAALLIHHTSLRTGVPTRLVQRLREDHPELNPVLTTWQHLQLGDVKAASALDADLARLGPTHPAFFPSLRLRLLWRLRSGDPAAAQEALKLMRPAVDTGSGPESLILRAELAEVAEDWTSLRASLAELGQKRQRLKRPPPPALKSHVDRLRQDPRFQDEHWQIVWDLFEGS